MGPASGDTLGDEVLATEFSADEFADLFDVHYLRGLAPVGPAPAITGAATLDGRIRTIAEARGYQRRPEPSADLVIVDGRLLQPDAAAAWTALKEAAAAAGHPLQLRSGYRSAADQASIFNGRLTDRSDEGIDRRLRTAAAPGYSKHHTGYAADITQVGHSVFTFDTTSGYEWVSADNFANAKRFGWVPSYPDGAFDQGPEPEPWELVWVGAVNIVCGDFRPTDGRTFCDTSGRSQLGDIEWLNDQAITNGCEPHRYCIDDSITRAQFITMSWRHRCRPERLEATPFVDLGAGRYYVPAVQWAWAAGVTTGVDESHFGPDLEVSRAEAVTVMWRALGRPLVVPDSPFHDIRRPSFYANAVEWAHDAAIVRGTSPTTFEPDRPLSRGEAASILNRLDQTGEIDRAECADP